MTVSRRLGRVGRWARRTLSSHPYLRAVVMGAVPYFNGPHDGCWQRISRLEALFGVFWVDTVNVLLLPDGVLETALIWDLDTQDPRFDEGMQWLGYYAADTLHMQMRWIPYTQDER